MKWPYQAWQIAGIVKHVLQRMHAKSSKGFNVGIPMVERVNVLVDKPTMDQPMSKIKVNISKVWQQDTKQQCLK
jgi:hypothetical protein